MTITLSPDIQQRIHDLMERGGFDTPEDVVRHAFDALRKLEEWATEPLDPEFEAELDKALDEADRGETIPWSQLREEFRKRYSGQ